MTRRLAAAFLLAPVALVALPAVARAERATVREYQKTFRTYPFSDPDPIADAGRIYPYFRFDGYTDRPVDQEWTVVELENDWIRVHGAAGDRRQDLDGGREVHREVVPLRQPGGEVPRRRDARPVDERRHRGELRHHRPHAELRDAGGLRDAREPGRQRLGRRSASSTC